MVIIDINQEVYSHASRKFYNKITELNARTRFLEQKKKAVLKLDKTMYHQSQKNFNQINPILTLNISNQDLRDCTTPYSIFGTMELPNSKNKLAKISLRPTNMNNSVASVKSKSTENNKHFSNNFPKRQIHLNLMSKANSKFQ